MRYTNVTIICPLFQSEFYSFLSTIGVNRTTVGDDMWTLFGPSVRLPFKREKHTKCPVLEEIIYCLFQLEQCVFLWVFTTIRKTSNISNLVLYSEHVCYSRKT